VSARELAKVEGVVDRIIEIQSKYLLHTVTMGEGFGEASLAFLILGNQPGALPL
jgi:hypothetical protein